MEERTLLTAGMVTLSGGIWVIQDTIASILYYIDKEDETWSYNQLLRVLRLLWGIAIAASGVYIIQGGW